MPRTISRFVVVVSYLLFVTNARPLPPRRYGVDFSHNHKSLLLNIRGGGKKTSSPSPANSHERKQHNRQDDINTNIENGIIVQSILIPRQTSFLKPLRFLSILLLNISFNSCLQTSGKPLEDTVRRILNMPSSDTDMFASKVTPIHIYVAKKINTSEMLPPGHLPSLLSLLGLFLSMILYIGGTVLLPRWSVRVDVFLNYAQIDVERDEAEFAMQNWFEENDDVGIDSYYFESASKKCTPSVLVYDKETQKTKICSLMRSPGYNDGESEENSSYLQHPKRYYFELDKTRYYYDPLKPQHIVPGGPTLHEVPLTSLLSNSYTRGLQSNAQLTYAYERYGSYSDITIPVPTLQNAFIQRITSPLVSLQLIGRLLSLLEEESLGRAFANLVRLGFQHFNDARRGIASAKTLAEEVQDLDKTGLASELESRFWAIRPAKATTIENELRIDAEVSPEWIQVPPKDLLPGDVFVVAPIANAAPHGSHSLSFPVDALVLDGTCVTEEAALTGETVPQPKVSLVLDEAGDSSEQLDMSSTHRSSCVFAGTKLLYSSNWDEGTESSLSDRFNFPCLPADTFTNDPALFLVLKTGSYSSRGSIIQSLLKSRTNFSSRSGEVESMKLIGGLAIFAFGACLFLLLEASDDSSHRSSVFKQIVQCTRIAIASVPSELPAYLASSAHECATFLRDEYNTVTSEAGALLESSQVDTVVFDKTGTLTGDTQALTSIVYPPRNQHRNKYSPEVLSQIVLAGGHSLIGIDNEDSNVSLVGDPLDLACLRHTCWQYDAHEKSAVSNENDMKLWQLKTFPFNPVKKLSSAIVLVQNKDGSFQLMVAVKGSPNKIRDLVKEELTNSWYDSQVKLLGKQGYRSIGLAALDATNTKAAKILFPLGIPNPNESKLTLKTRIHEARRLARVSIVRSDIEQQSSSVMDVKEMKFVGFACFNAPIRASSSRVVKELKSSAIDVIMLTGDESYASLAVASQAGIINDKQSTCLLKTNDSGLVWEISNKQQPFSLKAAKKVHRKVEKGKSTLVVTGDAVNALLSRATTSKTIQYVKTQLLHQTTLVASASPNDKSLFVKWLNSCNRNVLMCGDGVNDVKAMREALVSVAMLSGFDDTINDIEDAEDLRRKDRLKRRRIGSNRIQISDLSIIRGDFDPLDKAGIGNSLDASLFRIKKGVKKGLQQLQNGGDNLPQHTTDIFFSSIKDEYRRIRDLQKGGTSAAKILAEEDKLRRSLECKASVGNATVVEVDIKTGESCLASSFTLLRPCVGGVESILRTGVAAAACGIFTYRKVALDCILNCYNLATIYKNGLCYGNKMWQIELWSTFMTDSASYEASSTPRPRLVASIRPSASPFHPSEVLSTLSQALIHITTLTSAINMGRQLQSKYPTTSPHTGFSLKWNNENKSASTGSLLATLVGTSSSNSLHSDDSTPKSFFRRPPFQPNYIANNVFIVSIFEAAVTAMINHSGRPFSVGFLESRQLCLSVCLSFLLCIVCIAGAIPQLNDFVELAKYPTKASRLRMLRLLLLNVSMSYFAEYFSTFFIRHDIWKERNKPVKVHSLECISSMSAADEEEKLLSEEYQQNCTIVSLLCLIMLYFSVLILI